MVTEFNALLGDAVGGIVDNASSALDMYAKDIDEVKRGFLGLSEEETIELRLRIDGEKSNGARVYRLR